MEHVLEVTDSTFEKEVVKSDIPAIVDFWAEWCAPCKMIAPVVDEIAKEFKGRIKIVKLNVDDNTRTATDLTVMSIPTLLFFKDGREAGRVSGVVSKRELLKKIKELFHD